MQYIGVVLILLLIVAYLYTGNDHFTAGGEKPFLVLFSQDWCPACREFKPTWQKLKSTSAITDVVNIVELDHTQFNVGSFPTIRFYKRDPLQYPNEFVPFKSERNLGQLMRFVRENAF